MSNTAYTYLIEEGKVKTGKEFLKVCARSFGVLYNENLKLLDWEETIKEIKYDDYYSKRLKGQELDLQEFLKLTDKEIYQQITNQIKEEIEEKKESIKKMECRDYLYKEVLKDVRKWVPPTEEHEGLKKFAIEQITSSLWGDLINEYRARLLELETAKPNVAEYKKSYMEDYEQSTELYKTKLDLEKKNFVYKVEWIKNFLKSLE